MMHLSNSSSSRVSSLDKAIQLSEEVAYLAQHPLLDQIPSLRSDMCSNHFRVVKIAHGTSMSGSAVEERVLPCTLTATTILLSNLLGQSTSASIIEISRQIYIAVVLSLRFAREHE
jgi:hypothetical protein